MVARSLNSIALHFTLWIRHYRKCWTRSHSKGILQDWVPYINFGYTDLIQNVLVLAAHMPVPVLLGEMLLVEMKHFHVSALLDAFILCYSKKHWYPRASGLAGLCTVPLELRVNFCVNLGCAQHETIQC